MSNPIEDYINSLEGKTELDPLTIARDLRELSVKEIETRDAKISTLEGTIAEKDTAVAALTTDNTKWKAMNLDLAMQIPGNTNESVNEVKNDNEITPGDPRIQVSDLFNKSARSRHFRTGR